MLISKCCQRQEIKQNQQRPFGREFIYFLQLLYGGRSSSTAFVWSISFLFSLKGIALFQGKRVRRHWDNEKELWYFSVSDVVAVLTNSIDPLAYWRKLKERLLHEGGNETVTKCHVLKMKAADGK